MRKFICLLAALVLILSTCAFALKGSGYPAYDGTNFSDNHLACSFAGESLMLEFDPAGDYSFIENGKIQACFFAFDESKNHYIELYLELPADIKSGDILSSADFLRNFSSSSSVSFYEIDIETEVLYYAGSVMGVPYPEGSGFEIHIDEVSITETAAEVSGRLNASLVRFDSTTPTGEIAEFSEASFHFLLPTDAAAVTPKPGSPSPEAQPEQPAATPPSFNPAPAFTLPPDHITL